MRIKLTEANVNKLKTQNRGYWVSDTDFKGLRLYVGTTGTKTYYLTYRNKFGKSVSAKIGSADVITATDARATAKRLLAEMITTGSDIQQEKQAAKELPTVQDLYDAYLSAGKSPATVQRAKMTPFGERRADEITALMVEQWRAKEKQRRQIKSSSLNRYVGALKTIFAFAKRRGLIKVNPIESVSPLKEIDSEQKTRYLTPDERKRLLQALDDMDAEQKEKEQRFYDSYLKRFTRLSKAQRYNRQNPAGWAFGGYFKPLILLALNTGIRHSALLALKWEDVDLDHGVIYLKAENAKNKKFAVLPMNETTKETLTKWKAQRLSQSNPYIFVSPRRGPHVRHCIGPFTELLKRADIHNFRFHDLRHDFASQLVMKGVDLNTVRELMTHSDIKMTLRYAHLAPEKKQDAVRKLDSINNA